VITLSAEFSSIGDNRLSCYFVHVFSFDSVILNKVKDLGLIQNLNHFARFFTRFARSLKECSSSRMTIFND